MRKQIFAFIITASLAACGQQSKNGSFTLTGNIKNTPDQHVYLEQLFFSEKAPEVIDTAFIRNGKFELKGAAPEEGMFRIRLERQTTGFVFINDADKIPFEADLNKMDISSASFHTRANHLLKSFIMDMNKKQREIISADSIIKSARDSASLVSLPDVQRLSRDYDQFILQYIDSVSDPVVAMFALGYTQRADTAKLGKTIASMGNRFPKHEGVAAVINRYNQYRAQQDELRKREDKMRSSRPGIGTQAPDFTLSDTQGNPYSLSKLKGKYVLVDFWASWCGPCRGENPTVVAAYKKYSDKNFTVLGVSLDEEKDKWLKAIKDDNLTWKHVSDLKGWGSAVVPLYGFDGIPYNVLIDPSGKIIATELRGNDLEDKLAEVL